MVGTIAITDEGWYTFLQEHSELTELNFWTPSAHRSFRAPHPAIEVCQAKATASLHFEAGNYKRVAVKMVGRRGSESLKVNGTYEEPERQSRCDRESRPSSSCRWSTPFGRGSRHDGTLTHVQPRR